MKVLVLQRIIKIFVLAVTKFSDMLYIWTCSFADRGITGNLPQKTKNVLNLLQTPGKQ